MSKSNWIWFRHLTPSGLVGKCQPKIACAWVEQTRKALLMYVFLCPNVTECWNSEWPLPADLNWQAQHSESSQELLPPAQHLPNMRERALWPHQVASSDFRKGWNSCPWGTSYRLPKCQGFARWANALNRTLCLGWLRSQEQNLMLPSNMNRKQ